MTPRYFSHPKESASSHTRCKVVGRPFFDWHLWRHPFRAKAPPGSRASGSCETTWPPSETGAVGNRQSLHPATDRNFSPICRTREHPKPEVCHRMHGPACQNRGPTRAIPSVHHPFVPITEGFPACPLAPLRRSSTVSGWSKIRCDVRKNPVYLPSETTPPLRWVKKRAAFSQVPGFLPEPFSAAVRITLRSRGQPGGDGRPAGRRCVRHSLGEVQAAGAVLPGRQTPARDRQPA